MSTTIFTTEHATLTPLQGKTIAILGYGSQGHAHALNLRDSGQRVVVGVRSGRSRERALDEGLDTQDVDRACRDAEIIMVLLPDTRQAEVYRESIAPHLTAGKTLLFAHGFNIHYGQIDPPSGVDVAMIAPKTPGHRLRELYQAGGGAPALLAIHQDATGAAEATALAYAHALGATRAGVIATTFAEECETDLFGEQAVICGGVAALIQAGFDTLVEAGYQPEIAYFECLHEMKLIVDLIAEGGLEYMRHSISDTAEYGDLTRGGRIIDDRTRAEMRTILSEIQDGRFAREWILENRVGRPSFSALRRRQEGTTLATIGRRLRELTRPATR